MKKEWFFDRFCNEQLVVYAEDGKIVEVSSEHEPNGDVLGNIYKGRVSNVVAGMQAAFVSCGMERNCYLPLNEGAARFSTYDGEGGEKTRTLKEGDEVLVQVVKVPRGNKGAKVTCDLSFVGKNLIYLPTTDFLGISRKITDPATRAALLKAADKLRAEGEGFIVRTAAQDAPRKHLKPEAEYLKRMYAAALEAAKTAPVGTVVYREYDLPVKVMRDSLGSSDNKIYVGDRELYDKVLRLARMRANVSEKKITLHTGPRSMFAHFGLSGQVLALTDPRVELENGAYLIINRTEAMTVVDVNTGKFTGDTDLESTVFKVNLLAAREVARQVRLRNIAGMVAVDFIDMAEEEHRQKVNEALTRALEEDRTKSRVLPMNELGVTMFTRKRTTGELQDFLFQPCPHCTREGYVLSDVYMAMRIRSEIIDYFANGYKSVVIELNRGLMEMILSEHCFSIEARTSWADKRVYLIPHRTYHEEQFTIRGDNSDVLTLPDDAQILY